MCDMEKVKDGEIVEVKTGMVTGRIAMCNGCAHVVGVEESTVENDREDVVCVMCGEKKEDMRAIPVQADFNKWNANRDGQWDSPPWYLNPRINAAIRIYEPHGQMAVWIQILDRREIESHGNW